LNPPKNEKVVSPAPALQMTGLPEDLALISTKTLAHYNDHAAEFWRGTRDHDVRQNIDALLRHTAGAPPLRILDFGCGPGRDLAAFSALGHAPVGLEGSPPLAAMAREHSGCEVWEQNFLALELPDERFDGVFANASLFHVPSRELPRVLRELRSTLVSGGVLFVSNPRGDNDEGWHHDRYGVYHDLDSWRGFLQDAQFSELEHYHRPAGLPRNQQHWLATVWRKD
jgi:SAM-dependent methyltransferase